MVGPVSIRQLRIKASHNDSNCRHDITQQFTLNNACRETYNERNHEDSVYGNSAGGGSGGTGAGTYWWYRDSEGTRAKHIEGNFGSYPGGGYQVNQNGILFLYC